jgi:hypothetical protein
MPCSLVRLPRQVPDDFEVFVNGVHQRRGVDFRVEGRTLVFDRELKKEGRLGLWRWFLGAWGIGTYRQNDSVDVQYQVRGLPQVAEGLDIEATGEVSERGGGGTL